MKGSDLYEKKKTERKYGIGIERIGSENGTERNESIESERKITKVSDWYEKERNERIRSVRKRTERKERIGSVRKRTEQKYRLGIERIGPENGTERKYRIARKTMIIFEKKADFFQAWQDCDSNNGHLASIQSAYEQGLVEQAMAKTANPKGVYLIGGTDLGRDGRWMWIGLNEVLSNYKYRNFYPGEPNNIGNQHCLSVGNWGGENRGKWDDTECFKQYDGYVCEFETIDQPNPAN
uniref:C-type lectin domain-containing protein n=1 Tax=Anopheles culicifacies TaxID=139723 RepID=A0A182LZN4_9DIPT